MKYRVPCINKAPGHNTALASIDPISIGDPAIRVGKLPSPHLMVLVYRLLEVLSTLAKPPLSSHRGDVTPCGYLPIVAGNIREQPFREIYSESVLFRSLCNLDGYGGKCGVCEFLRVCGVCRARAYSLTGNYLAEEPYCLFQPRKLTEAEA
jgi:radical SAM protein with 4Fe4S-binding SPASM domain